LLAVRAEKNMVISEEAAEVSRFDSQLLDKRKELEAGLDKALAQASAEDRPKWEGFRSKWERYLPISDKIREHAKANDDTKARELMTGEGRQIIDDLEKDVEDIVAVSEHEMTLADDAAEENYQSARLILLSVVGVAFLIAMAMATWILINISRGLSRA